MRNLERLAGADIFDGIYTGPLLADISESTALKRRKLGARDLPFRRAMPAAFPRGPDGAI